LARHHTQEAFRHKVIRGGIARGRYARIAGGFLKEISRARAFPCIAIARAERAMRRANPNFRRFMGQAWR
jgi:hypothetical protein